MLGRSASQAVGREEDVVAKRQIAFRLPRDILAVIERLAKADDRTLTYVITKLLREALAARKLLK